MKIYECNSFVDSRNKELVTHGTPLFPIACYYDEFPKNTLPIHWHEELEIGIVQSGKATLRIDMQTMTLEPNQGYFANANVLHGAKAIDGENCEIHSMVFHPKLIGAMESVFWQKYINPVLSDKAFKFLLFDNNDDFGGKITYCFENVWELYENEPFGFEFGIRNNLSEIILMLNEHEKLNATNVIVSETLASERIKIMLMYINEHLGEEIKINDIAKSALISKSECLRCFAKIIGVSPIKYVKELRMGKAAYLIKNTSMKINEIAYECGLLDMSYFSKSFKEMYGCSPSEYRTKN